VHSQTMAPILEDVANDLKGTVNVGRVDVMKNRELGTRFGIKGFPSLILFSQGHLYNFKGRRSVEELVEFARGGFQIHEPETVPKEMGLFGEFWLVSRHAYKEATIDLLAGNYFTVHVLCMALPIIFSILFLFILFVPFSTSNLSNSSATPTAVERGPEIPVSQRARPPTSSSDSHFKKPNKEE
jgi:hypothetical protein